MWALPGGYNPQGETTMDALTRIIKEKTGVAIDSDLRYIEQLYTFDTVARDPRGHAVSVTYTGYGREITPAADEAVDFFPITQLPDLAYDHADIIRYAHERLISKLSYTNAVYAFLPRTFTMAELQSAYEAIFGHELDKRNFRKKFLSLELIHETTEMKRTGAHRPARLYEFNSQTLESLPRSFD
jgi:8-oxo-dGTP diphosphatase